MSKAPVMIASQGLFYACNLTVLFSNVCHQEVLEQENSFGQEKRLLAKAYI